MVYTRCNKGMDDTKSILCEMFIPVYTFVKNPQILLTHY